ncbi:hypothetical protein B4Q13_24085 [Lacticaseibacillus rhamnosus]
MRDGCQGPPDRSKCLHGEAQADVGGGARDQVGQVAADIAAGWAHLALAIDVDGIGDRPPAVGAPEQGAVTA